MEEGQYVPIHPQPHGGQDKQSRAAGFQGIASMGRVSLPLHHPLVELWLDQHLKFPAGRRKDAVDASGAFGRYVNKLWGASPPLKEDNEVKLDTPAGTFTMPGLLEVTQEETW